MKELRRSLEWLLDTSAFERRAIMVLLFVVGMFILKRVVTERGRSVNELDVHRLNALVAQIDSAESLADKLKTPIMLKCKIRPNSDSYEMLVAAGLPERLASNMINYRQKVRPFKTLMDLKKLYAMNESSYHAIKDSVLIVRERKVRVENKQIEMKDINTISSAELLALKGIGKAISHRVVSYRNLLGGYVVMDQLKEVYGLSHGAYGIIQSVCDIDTSKVKRIPVNDVTFEELIRHPYIGRLETLSLIRYRDSVGRFNSLRELHEVKNLSEKTIRRLMPYFQL